MTGVHLLAWTQQQQRSVLSRRHSVSIHFFCVGMPFLTIREELQGHDSQAVIGEMRDSLIDNWA